MAGEKKCRLLGPSGCRVGDGIRRAPSGYDGDAIGVWGDNREGFGDGGGVG